MIRRLHQFYAWAFGYFWIPCPVCGRMFGGHEVGEARYTIGPGHFRATCKLHNA